MGKWDMRSDKSYKDPLEFAELDEDDEDASSEVSKEEDIEDPFEIVEATPRDDDLSESQLSFSIKSHFSSFIVLEYINCSPHEP